MIDIKTEWIINSLSASLWSGKQSEQLTNHEWNILQAYVLQKFGNSSIYTTY